MQSVKLHRKCCATVDTSGTGVRCSNALKLAADEDWPWVSAASAALLWSHSQYWQSSCIPCLVHVAMGRCHPSTETVISVETVNVAKAAAARGLPAANINAWSCQLSTPGAQFT